MSIKWTADQKAKASEEILARVRAGASLSNACKGDDWIAPRKTFERWCDEDEALMAEYTRARDQRAEKIFEECLTIADSQEGDVLEDGSVNHDMIARARLRIDTRRWMLGKMQPKKYGDKVALTDGDGGPLQVVIRRHAED